MFTLDTHFSKTDKNDATKEQHIKFVKVASLLIVDFLNWLKEQSFGENTTVIIIGDHERMGTNFPEQDKDNIYNVFINTKETTQNRNRIFNQTDLFPTILESIGFKIDGDRLGLGTSLFSTKPTLIEQLGYKKLKKMLRYKNKLCNNIWAD
jgi:phosphoglycerol transferase